MRYAGRMKPENITPILNFSDLPPVSPGSKAGVGRRHGIGANRPASVSSDVGARPRDHQFASRAPGPRERQAGAARASGPHPTLYEDRSGRCFARRSQRSAEPALLGLLTHRAEPVRLAAVTALGRIGTIRAVETLLPLTKGVLALGEKKAARDAIAIIQARLGEAEAGRL